jgi:hypothetical protein
MIEAKDFRTFIRLYFLFKNERLSPNNKLILHKPDIKFTMTYANTTLRKLNLFPPSPTLLGSLERANLIN